MWTDINTAKRGFQLNESPKPLLVLKLRRLCFSYTLKIGRIKMYLGLRDLSYRVWVRILGVRTRSDNEWIQLNEERKWLAHSSGEKLKLARCELNSLSVLMSEIVFFFFFFVSLSFFLETYDTARFPSSLSFAPSLTWFNHTFGFSLLNKG